MRRLGRWMLNAVTLLSLLVLVAMVVLWVRSHSAYDEWRWATRGGRLWIVESGNGKLVFATVRGWPLGERLRWQSVERERDPDGLAIFTYGQADRTCYSDFSTSINAVFSPSWRAGVGRACYRTDGVPPVPGEWDSWSTDAVTRATSPLPYYQRSVFHGALILLLVVPPTAWLLGQFVREVAGGVRRRGIARGLCPCCHYDLTGNVSGVCPECGTKVPVPTGLPPTPSRLS